ncbi:aminoglycoside phosphotransferase family protein [Paenibacillus sp. UNC451MF]|uniref:aminoglycoside phosphotransferase family protein n=1 Tax=Paenibacillus sp. UNC451MF TaxID=1449063 RepID=UPI000490F721|nr:aminoglycoside phosphotransferase family protein [Paenibacillus sp. UNC451MF]
MELGQKLGQGRQAEVFGYQKDQVVKLFYPNTPHYVIEHEFKIAASIQQPGLPVAKVFEIITVNDRTGIVYEKLEGPTLLQMLLSDVSKAVWIGEISAHLHADVHRSRNDSLPSQKEDFEKKIRTVKIESVLKEKALRLLDTLPDSSEVCHGDYHPDNILLSPSGPYVIDWINAKRGNRTADFVLSALMLKIGEVPDFIPHYENLNISRSILFKAYTQTYLKELPTDKSDILPWIPLAAIFRLEQGIESEHSRLIKIIRRSLSSI